MAKKINKKTKTFLAAADAGSSDYGDLKAGEIKAITKSMFVGNIAGGESGGSAGSASATASALDAGIDLNTLVGEGKYYADGSNKSPNKPSGVAAFGLTVVRTAMGWYTQFLVSSNQNTGSIYERTYNGTSWTDWVRLATANDLNGKQNKLKAGSNITISSDSTISAAQKEYYSHSLSMYWTSEDQTKSASINAIVYSSDKTAVKNPSQFPEVFGNNGVVYVTGVYVDTTAKIKTIIEKIQYDNSKNTVLYYPDTSEDMGVLFNTVNATSAFTGLTVSDVVTEL